MDSSKTRETKPPTGSEEAQSSIDSRKFKPPYGSEETQPLIVRSEANPSSGSWKATSHTYIGEAEPSTGSSTGEPPTGSVEAKPPTDHRKFNPPYASGEAQPPTVRSETKPSPGNGKAKPHTDIAEAKQSSGSRKGKPPTDSVEAKPPTNSKEEKQSTGSGKAKIPTDVGKANPPTVSTTVTPVFSSREVEPLTSNREVSPLIGSIEASPPTGSKKIEPSIGRWEVRSPTGSGDGNPAIGIDLGTWKCCVGVVRNGKVEIIENERGSKTTPSYVAFTETERLVGEEAKTQAALNPENTIFDVKRIVGQKFGSTTFLFKVDREKNRRSRVKIKYRGKETLLFPEQVSAMLLTKMKHIAESHLGCLVRDAVISVPANFNNAQRQATKDAGAIAGLNVLGLINEPTAAALAYQDNKGPTHETICVVDLGGGTLDVSLIKMEGNKGITVLETSGDTAFGGMDFDQKLVQYFKKEFHEQNKEDISGNKKAILRLRLACEKLKHTLSLLRADNIQIDSLANGKDFASSMTREKFDSLLFESFDTVFDSVIGRTQMNRVDRIVIIGGSTRLCMVEQKLGSLHKKLDRSVNPDEAVAHGAAIHAANLRNERNSLRDIYPHMIGYRTGGATSGLLQSHPTPLPHEKTVLVKGNGSTVLPFQVFERCLNLLKTSEYQEYILGELEFGKVDHMNCLELLCKLNKDGIYSTEVKFPVPQNHSVESMIAHEKDFMQEEKDENQRQAAIHEVEAYIGGKKSVIDNLKVAAGDKVKFRTVCEDILAFLEDNPFVSEEECNHRYRQVEDLFNSLIEPALSESSTVREQTLVSDAVKTKKITDNSGETTNVREDNQLKNARKDPISRKSGRRHSNPEDRMNSDPVDSDDTNGPVDSDDTKGSIEIDRSKPTNGNEASPLEEVADPLTTETRKGGYQKIGKVNFGKIKSRSKNVSYLKKSKSTTNLSEEKSETEVNNPENQNSSNKFMNILNKKFKSKLHSSQLSKGRSDKSGPASAAVAGQEAQSGRQTTKTAHAVSGPASAAVAAQEAQSGRQTTRTAHAVSGSASAAAAAQEAQSGRQTTRTAHAVSGPASAAAAAQEAQSGRQTTTTAHADPPSLLPVARAAAKRLGLTHNDKNRASSVAGSATESQSRKDAASTPCKKNKSTGKLFDRISARKEKTKSTKPKDDHSKDG